MNIFKKVIFKLRRNRALLEFKAKTRAISDHMIYLTFKNKEGYYLPYSAMNDIDRRQLFMVSKGLSGWLTKKYTTDEIKVNDGDIVIDCGAFIGGFTRAAAQCGAQHIYSIEPSSKNYQCLLLNIDHHNIRQMVTPINMGLGNKVGLLRLNLSSSGCDDSFLAPDEGDLSSSELVQVTTLKDLIEQYKIDVKKLYLKVEAEGFEPEIIKGLKDLRPRNITVDITPERDGKSPKDEIQVYLESLGYKTIPTKRCLFAVYQYHK